MLVPYTSLKFGLPVALSLRVHTRDVAPFLLAQHLCLFWVFNPFQVVGQSVMAAQLALRQSLVLEVGVEKD